MCCFSSNIYRFLEYYNLKSDRKLSADTIIFLQAVSISADGFSYFREVFYVRSN